MDGLMILTSRVKVPILIEIFQPKVNVNIGNVKNKEFWNGEWKLSHIYGRFWDETTTAFSRIKVQYLFSAKFTY